MDYATLLRDQVTLTCRSVDRIFLQGYVPQLQTPGWVARFLMQRGFPIPSSAALGKIGDEYTAAVRRWAKASGVPVHYFKKGESKEAYARPLIEAAAKEGDGGRVVLLGIAQEKSFCWRAWRTKSQEYTGRPHMEWSRQAAFINHFYFYLCDPDWGGAFWKSNAYAPYPIWIYLNGHGWAKRQLEKAGIDYQALDNGFRSCANPFAWSESAPAWARGRCRTSSGGGSIACPRRSRSRTCAPATCTSSRSASSRSPTPASSNGRPRVGPSSRA